MGWAVYILSVTCRGKIHMKIEIYALKLFKTSKAKKINTPTPFNNIKNIKNREKENHSSAHWVCITIPHNVTLASSPKCSAKNVSIFFILNFSKLNQPLEIIIDKYFFLVDVVCHFFWDIKFEIQINMTIFLFQY